MCLWMRDERKIVGEKRAAENVWLTYRQSVIHAVNSLSIYNTPLNIIYLRRKKRIGTHQSINERKTCIVNL